MYIYINTYYHIPLSIQLYEHSSWLHRPVSAPAEPGPVEPVVPVELVGSTAVAWPRPEPSVFFIKARGRELENLCGLKKKVAYNTHNRLHIRQTDRWMGG